MAAWYYAYGSNLDFVQMRSRCPTAQFICRAVLKDHTVEFTRRSATRKGGVADVISQPGHDVWGVIYLLDDRDLAALDDAEGYQADREPERNAYLRKNGVKVQAENDPNQIMRVSIYFAVKLPNPPRPNEAYMRQIIDGAKFWKLPLTYIEELQQVHTFVDTA